MTVWTLVLTDSMLDVLDRVGDQRSKRMQNDLVAYRAELSRSLAGDGLWDSVTGAFVDRSNSATATCFRCGTGRRAVCCRCSRWPRTQRSAKIASPDARWTCSASEAELLSGAGLRSVSRAHRDVPFELDLGSPPVRGDYQPGTSQARCSAGTQTAAVR